MEEGLQLAGDRLAPGVRVGPYVVVGHLATGGMGEVYLARRSGGQVLVLKVMLSHLAEDERNAELFVAEARLAASLVHPNIVRVFDSGRDQRLSYLTMEYLTGHPVATCLKAVVKSGGTVPEAIAARIVADAAEGLAHAHKAKGEDGEPLELVHRDVSPDNLFVTFEGVTKLLDFGVAKVAGASGNTLEGEFKGKVQYMAPETARGEPFDARSDLFSLGVVFFELLTSRRLFGADNPAQSLHLLLNEPIPSIKALRPELDPELARICEFLLVREPDRRVQDADTVSEWLRTWLRAKRVKAESVAGWLQSTFPEAHQTSARLLDSLKQTGEFRLDDAVDVRLLGTGRFGDVKVPDLGPEARIGPEPAAKVLGEVQPSFSANYYRSLTVDEHESVWDEDSASRIQRKRRRFKAAAVSGLAAAGLLAVGAFVISRDFFRPPPPPTQPVTAAVVAPPPPPEPDLVADRYRRGTLIYADAHGAYHQATDGEAGGQWLLRTHVFDTTEHAAKKGELLERARERIAELELPLFLPVITTEVRGSEVRVIHPAIEGRVLADALTAEMASSEARRLVRELTALFVAAELAGLVHGSLRPTELILAKDGALYVSGLSLEALPLHTGDPDPYRAPEVDALGGSLLADQFSVAAICQEILRTFDHEAYLGTARIVAKAMAADPDKRFETLEDFARALDRELGAKRSRRRR